MFHGAKAPPPRRPQPAVGGPTPPMSAGHDGWSIDARPHSAHQMGAEGRWCFPRIRAMTRLTDGTPLDLAPLRSPPVPRDRGLDRDRSREGRSASVGDDRSGSGCACSRSPGSGKRGSCLVRGSASPDAPDVLAVAPTGDATLIVRVGKPEPERVERDVSQNGRARSRCCSSRRGAWRPSSPRRARRELARAGRLSWPAGSGAAGRVSRWEDRRVRATVTIVSDHLYLERAGRTGSTAPSCGAAWTLSADSGASGAWFGHEIQHRSG